MIVRPGIRDVVQIAGFGSSQMLVTRPPTKVTLKPEFEEIVRYFLDGTPQVDRPLKWTSVDTASPDVARRWTIGIEFESLSSRDYARVLEIQAAPCGEDDEPFSICVWRPIVETFTCDGVRSTFRLSALPAVTTAGAALIDSPPQGFAGYATEVYLNGTISGSIAVTAQSFASTGRDQGDRIDVYHVPVFSCRRSGAECSFGATTLEGLSLEFETIQ